MEECDFGNEPMKVIRQFCCDICQKTVKSKRSLKRHEQIHTGTKVPLKIVNCKICEKPFKSKYNLARHNAVFHDDKKVQSYQALLVSDNSRLVPGFLKL